ncbi:MAG: recombinase family protein [Candidatus Pacearchaeota archaeon]
MRKVIGYCRTSTENQKEDKTIELQVQSINEYANQNGLEVVEFFEDAGVSGGLEQRPELGRMLEFLEANDEVETILIYSLSRLARDLYIQEGLIREFSRLKKEVISLTEPDLGSNDATRKLFRQVLGAFSEFEKAIITLRMKTGRDNSVISKGNWHGGVVYGYESKEGNLVVNDTEAEIIKRIYHLKNRKKYTLTAIANELNKDGIPTKRNKGNWYPSTIKKILNNKMYRGFLSYKGKKIKGNYQSII